MVAAEAHATQTPVALPAMMSLAAVATCCAPKIRVLARPGWSEPTNIFVCVALSPGSRKSAVFSDAVVPLHDFELTVGEAMQSEMASATALVRAAKQRQTAAEEAAARKNSDDRLGAEAHLREATSELLAMEAALPIAPRLICSDVTQERLTTLLAEQGGCMALMDAEGCGPIAMLLGRYNARQQPQVEVFLKAHAGDSICVDRIGRDGVAVSCPRLTVGMTIQPSVLERFGHDPQLRGVGLLARFLWSVPENTMGTRVARPAPVPDSVRRDYARALRELLELERAPNGEPHAVRLSRGADDLLADFQDWLEPRLGPGGDLAHLSDWAGKLAGAVVRIAGLIHAAETLQDVFATEISPSTLAQAISIGHYLLAHAQLALAQACTDPIVVDAEHVVAWFRMNKTCEISARDLFSAHKARFEKMDRLQPVLALLKSHHWVLEVEQVAEVRRGRKPSPIYRVHPSVHAASER
jgi:replicative DNA helicase